MVVSTPDPLRLAAEQTTYLYTAMPASQASPHEIDRLDSLREWIEVFYRQAKAELGWHDWQVRQNRAILRHSYLFFCAYTFVGLHGLIQAALRFPTSFTFAGWLVYVAFEPGCDLG